MKKTMLALLCALLSGSAVAQRSLSDGEVDFEKLSWKQVATRLPDAWYGTDQARETAEAVLDAQFDCGGWFKNLPYHRMQEKDLRELARYKEVGSAIFDNDATTMEMRFLSKVYAHRPDPRYKEAFNRGLRYIMEAQYDNGGWPMFYPLTERCYAAHGVVNPVTGKNYIGHITFNDNAIVNLLSVLREIYTRTPDFAALTDDDVAAEAKRLFYKGVRCILDCQIRGVYEQYVFSHSPEGGEIIGDRRTGDGPLTAWCAQHDAETLEPAQARAYEFPSYSGGESAGILQLLMSIDPDDIPAEYPGMREEIERSVVAAVEWFDALRIEGKRMVWTGGDGKDADRVITDAPGRRDLWARFYELTTCRPIFGMYDFVRLYDYQRVTPARRRGYSWYSSALAPVIDELYPAWRERHGL